MIEDKMVDGMPKMEACDTNADQKGGVTPGQVTHTTKHRRVRVFSFARTVGGIKHDTSHRFSVTTMIPEKMSYDA